MEFSFLQFRREGDVLKVYRKGLSSAKDKQLLDEKMRHIRMLPPGSYPDMEKIRNFTKMTVGNHRLYFVEVSGHHYGFLVERKYGQEMKKRNLDKIEKLAARITNALQD